MALPDHLHQRLLPDPPPNKIHLCPSDISPSYHRLGVVEGLEMRARRLVSPRSHCFGHQTQSRRCQPEKYNLRARHLAGSRELCCHGNASLHLTAAHPRVWSHPHSGTCGTPSAAPTAHTRAPGRFPPREQSSPCAPSYPTQTPTVTPFPVAPTAPPDSTALRELRVLFECKPCDRPRKRPAEAHVLSGAPATQPPLHLPLQKSW